MADVLLFPSIQDADAPELADAFARRQALDVRQSFVVEAPAGSGKTGLLIQRYLKLLADPGVTSPEQVLAITFTRKATAEMRDRVLAHLRSALDDEPPGHPEFERETRGLAKAVLARADQPGWSLLTEPARLCIRTIDSLCAEIARMLPVLSGSGGRISPIEQAAPLYREAARRTLLHLGGSDIALHAALREVLLHRDGNLANCEALIADMLSLRDQWGELIWGMRSPEQNDTQTQPLDDAYLDSHVLPRLEAAMHTALCAALTEVQLAFPPDLLQDAAEIASDVIESQGMEGDERLATCKGRRLPPTPCSADLEHWKALVFLLVRPSGKTWRKGLSALGGQLSTAAKTRLQSLLSRLVDREELRELLCDLRDLPQACYPPDQWRVAKALFRVLSQAMVELQVVFAERERCDFAELGLLARHALSQSSGADDLAEAAGARLQHLLIDEMQDTSSGQYHLLETLTSSWDGRSQTIFLVGDPRQSIYLFRQARVERFLRAISEKRLGDLPLQHLKLSSNFRSQETLVNGFNEQFAAIFPQYSDALPYSPAQAVLPPSELSGGVTWHAHIIPHANKTTKPSLAELQQQQRRRDAQEVVGIVREWFAKPLPEDRRRVRTASGVGVIEPWRIAVLVRSRNHLAEIATALNDARIPTRTVNIEPLSERQEILDLTALTRVLLHPADRVAGLAALRAPWCGLPLADLHLLTGADDPGFRDVSIPRLLADRSAILPEDSRLRVERLRSVLDAAAEQRGRMPIAQLVEKAWRSLGGDVLLDTSELANADRYFQLLAQIDREAREAGTLNFGLLDARLRDLYAENKALPPDVAHVELLTIHKAKGLEWDVVIVPALERPPERGKLRLLAWTTFDGKDDDSAGVMLAPIGARGNDSEPLVKWLGILDRKRELAEHKRLFYVACTRARQDLHLFAAPKEGAQGELKPRPGTLLYAAWPTAQRHFSQPALPAFRRSAEEDTGQVEIAAAATVSPRSAGLRRIPVAFDPRARFEEAGLARHTYGEREEVGIGGSSGAAAQLFERPEGSFAARALGNVVHSSLDLLAKRIAAGATRDGLRSELYGWLPRISSMLRLEGLPRTVADRLATETVKTLEQVLSDRDGFWILSPHPHAASELSLTSELPFGFGTATVRADRVFRAGSEPQEAGEDFFWIVDYKTSAHSKGGLDAFLARQREVYGSQLETYARLLAPGLGADLNRVRVALYFPAIPRLLWWDPKVGS